MRRRPIDVVLRRCEFGDGGCWLWTGSPDADGYAALTVMVDGALVFRRAHRITYEFFNGPIPEGLEIDHLCRIRHCCNPNHLEAVTHRENLLRGNTAAAHNARKTHCKHGHEFTSENTYVVIRRDQIAGRMCRQCNRDADKRYQARVRASAGPGLVEQEV